MVQSRNFARTLGLASAIVLFLLALGVPVSGGTASADKVASQPSKGVSVPSEINCAQAAVASDTPIFELPEGGSCKADSTWGTLPNWTPVRGGRTCRCSCGFPCKTDADCGGGVGSCRGGISCC
jgi:hypothetical protein